MGSFVGSWLGGGTLNKLWETGGHLSEPLKPEYIRVAADQKSYSNTEDARGRENQQPFGLEKQKGRPLSHRHWLVNELPVQGTILCAYSWGQAAIAKSFI